MKDNYNICDTVNQAIHNIITRTSIVTGVIDSGRIVWPYARHGGSFRFRRITRIPPKPSRSQTLFRWLKTLLYIGTKHRSPENQQARWFPRPAFVLYKSIQIPWLQAKRNGLLLFTLATRSDVVSKRSKTD